MLLFFLFCVVWEAHSNSKFLFQKTGIVDLCSNPEFTVVANSLALSQDLKQVYIGVLI
jgi:hypothetical protein